MIPILWIPFILNMLFGNIQSFVTKPPVEVPIIADCKALNMEELTRLNGGTAEIRYDPKTGIPREINGIFSAKGILSSEDAVQALWGMRELMQITSKDFCCLEKSERRDLRVFTLQQLYQGVPVEDAIFYITAKKDGTPVSISGIFEQGLALETAPSVSASEARESVSLQKGDRITAVSLVIWSAGGSCPRLSWRCQVSARDPLRSRYVYVDAMDKSVLAERALAMS